MKDIHTKKMWKSLTFLHWTQIVLKIGKEMEIAILSIIIFNVILMEEIAAEKHVWKTVWLNSLTINVEKKILTIVLIQTQDASIAFMAHVI